MFATDPHQAENTKAHRRGQAKLWPVPRPLSAALAEVCPFDPELLPESLRPWVLDLAERLQVPADYPAAALIVMLAGALGRRAFIHPQRHDNWSVIPNLWGAIIWSVWRDEESGAARGNGAAAAAPSSGDDRL
jgi:hypothetical protein